MSRKAAPKKGRGRGARFGLLLEDERIAEWHKRMASDSHRTAGGLFNKIGSSPARPERPPAAVSTSRRTDRGS